MSDVAKYIGKLGSAFFSDIGKRMQRKQPGKIAEIKMSKTISDPAESVKDEVSEEENKGLSDENLKKIYGDNLSDRLVEDFAKIRAIDFKYTPEAQQEYSEGELSVDNNEHTGVTAQNLEEVESTAGAVSTNMNGDKEVDTNHLTFANTATIGELSRRVLALEEVVKELSEKLKEKELS
jgi:hypothetical protein